MQVFKKICALALAGLLIGCRSTSVTTDSGIYDSISDIDEAAFEAPSSFRCRFPATPPVTDRV